MFKPKLIITGYKKHGKGTACEILAARTRGLGAYNHMSSSMWCCKEFIFEALKGEYGYKTVEECYDDRVNHRVYWYEAIKHFNRNSPSRLASRIFADYDIYDGICDAGELHGVREAGLVDLVIWVDSTGRGLPPEGRDSMTVTESSCDVTIHNNGTKEDFAERLNLLIDKVERLWLLNK